MSMIDTYAHDAHDHTQGLASKFAVKAIEGYRGNKLIKSAARLLISGRTDFKCASGAMGLDTCSTSALKSFTNYPLWEAIQRQREAFAECGKMAKILKIVEDNSPDEASTIIQMQFGEAAENAEHLVMMASNENRRKKQRQSSSSNNNSSDCCFAGLDGGADAACCVFSLFHLTN